MGNFTTNETIDVHYFINFIKKHWLAISICVFTALVISFLINKYSTKVYSIATSLVIKEENGGLSDASAQLLNDFGFISTNKSFANELLVLQSSPLIIEALEELDFQISYFEHEFLSKRELYKSSPFIVILDKNYPQPVGVTFNVEFLSETTYKIYADAEKAEIFSFVSDNKVQEIDKLHFEKIVTYDSYLYSDYMRFKISLNSSVDFEDLKGQKFSFHINTQKSLLNYYKNQIEVIPPDLESTVAEVKLQTQNPSKGKDFLNALTGSYIKSELEKKRHTSIRTIEYINDQLNIVGDSLARAEQNLQTFRTRNEVADLSIQTGQFYDELRELENQKAALSINNKYYNYVKSYFNQNNNDEELIAPSAMGIDDPMLNNLIEELIRLKGERASFIENNQGKSPYLKKINIRIENLRKMVSENISYYEQTNNIKLDDINVRISKLNSEIRKIPATQRALVGIERKFNVNDAIYTYLLEKKAEAEIAKASYLADTEIIEPAYVVGARPVSPKTSLNYILGVMLGLIIPISFFRISELTRTTFSSISEVESNVDFPVLGKIFHNDKSSERIVDEYPQALVSENFRHLHVGLKYFFKDKKCKTILFSSTISGEGKSFTALNSAITISNSGYKTVLLAFDLRKDGLGNLVSGFISANKKHGLTEYLSGQAQVNDIISSTKNNNLDIVLSGSLAPNPAELITSEQTDKLFKQLVQEYDYIIIDSSPIGLVTDAYNLSAFSDLSVIMVRLKVTPKSEFKSLQEDLKAKDVKACVIVNDISKAKGSDYGYYNEKK